MNLDAIIIADSGVDSLSGTNPLKLKLDGEIASVQAVAAYLQNKGKIIHPVKGDNIMSWASAPKLNGIYIYSYLTRKGFNVYLINNFVKEKNKFAELLKRKPSAIIVSTAFIFFKKALRELAKDIRTLVPDIYIIAGGSFVYYSYLISERASEPDYETELAKDDFLFLEFKDEPEIDHYIISPRGETILCETLDRIKRNMPLDSLPNSAFLSEGEYIFTQKIDDISGTPSPEINWDSLPDKIFETGVIPLQASNGCPYNCTFCNFTKDKRLMFVKPIDQLVSEIKSVTKRGVKYIWFVDDNFRLGKDDLDVVCRRFIDEDIRVRWMCFIRASTLRNSDIALLKRAGCMEVQIGLESGDEEILRNMNKQVDPGTYRYVIRELLKNGINVSCYFISGFPGETEESAQRTRDFIKSIEYPELPGILSWSIYPFILSPLSPIYEPEMREKYGLTGYLTNWAHTTMNYQEAKKHIVKTFLELENSGPIYREDNLENIEGNLSKRMKDFFSQRNKLSKLQIRGKITQDEIVKKIGTFFL